MKGPLTLILFAACACLLVLWLGVKWFVGSTEDKAYRVTNHLRDVTAATQVGPPGDEAGSEAISGSAAGAGAINAGPAESNARPGRVENGSTVSTGSGSLGADERQAREAARRQKLTELGIISDSAAEPTTAIDVKLEMPEQCEGVDIALVPIGVKFRFESSIIKAESLNDLESLVALYRKCSSGRFMLMQNPLGRTDAAGMLTEMRFDEIKYFFIQHSVSLDAVQFPEK